MAKKCQLILQEGILEIERSLEHSIIRSPQVEQFITTSNKQTLLKCDSSFGLEENLKKNDSLTSPNFSTRNQMITTQIKPKQFSKLLIYCHSMKFANRLISLIKPCSKFTVEQFNMINDKASFFNGNLKVQKQITKNFISQNLEGMNFQFRWRLQYRKLKKKALELLQSYYSQVPLVEPDSQKLFFWEVLLTVIRIYLIIWIPIIIVFHNSELEYHNQVSIYISSILLLFDIFLRGITIVYDKGYPVDNRFILISRQLNFSNFIEVTSIFTGIILASKFNENFHSSILDSEGWIKLLLILYLLQLKNFVKFMNNLQYYYKPNKEVSSIIDLFKLMGLILLIQHFCACIWLIIGTYQHELNHQTWFTRVENQNWGIQYLESFYFMSVTMFTVGYGDISPLNSLEKVFCICYMFLSTLQLSYSVNTIGAILTLLKEKNEIFRQKMTCINEYLKDKQISQQLQYKYLNELNRIREFCNFYWEQDIIQKKNEQELIIKELPEDLQFQLKLEQAKQLVKNCSFFKLNFSKSSIQYIIQRVGFTAYQPGTIIKITPQNSGVFIIERGNIEVIFNQTKLTNLKDFDQFGFEEYINNQFNPNIYYKTTTFTSIFCIPFSIINEAIKKSKSDFEKIQLNKQILKSNYCYICKNQRHSNEQCKLVHFVPDKEKAIKTYLLFDSQERSKIKRFYRNKKISALLQQQYVESVSKIAQQELEEIIDATFPELTYEALLKPLNSTQRICESPKENEIFRPQRQNNFLLETIKTSQLRTSDNNAHQISITFRNMDISPFIYEPDIMKELQLKMLNIHKYKQKQQVDLFILYKQLEIQNHTCFDLPNFEITRTYKRFDPDWNLKNIIEQVNLKYMHSELYQETMNRFSKYLLYPLEFIYRFKKEITQQRAESYQNRKIKDSDDEKSDLRQISKQITILDVIRKFERRKALIFPKSFTIK